MTNAKKWLKVFKEKPRNASYKCYEEIKELECKRVAECDCGESYLIWTSDDNDNESYTNIALECSCGNLLKMKIPVNS